MKLDCLVLASKVLEKELRPFSKTISFLCIRDFCSIFLREQRSRRHINSECLHTYTHKYQSIPAVAIQNLSRWRDRGAMRKKRDFFYFFRSSYTELNRSNDEGDPSGAELTWVCGLGWSGREKKLKRETGEYNLAPKYWNECLLK